VVAREARGFKSRTLTEDHPLASDVCGGIYVRGNEQYLQRMVGALIDNALKYSVDGGPIEVRLERHLHQAELSVRNATEGVDPKEVGRWFGRFYQSDRARTHEAGGYGIGLSMVEAVARAHGGKARAEAEADGSSVTMVVTLPTTRDPTQRAWRHETEGGSDER
jgi:signal transduction histidine kinase